MGVETYDNKYLSQIRTDVENEFKAIEDREEGLFEYYRDDQQIYAAGVNIIDRYIKKLSNANAMWVSNEKWGVKDGQAQLIKSENLYKAEALKFFREKRATFNRRWNEVLKEKDFLGMGFYITSAAENKAQINEVASAIDNAENEALKMIKLKCNPMQENVNAEENSSVVRDKQGNVRVNGSEVVRQKPMFNTDRKTGVMTFTDRCNPLTIDQALNGLFKKDDIVYEIDYTHCTNQKIKNKMMELMGGEAKCLIKKDKQTGTYLIRNSKGETLENRALIWEGVKLKRDELRQWEAREKKKAQNAQLGHIDAKVDDPTTPENDPELKKFVDKIPSELRSKLRNLGNTEYRRFIIETENRLNVILKRGKENNYELETPEPVSKVGITRSGLMEVHFINDYGERDVTVWDDETILGEQLYDLLDGNESDYKTYLTTRVEEKWYEFDDLTHTEDLNLKKKENEEGIDIKGKQQMLYGLGLLETMIENYRKSEGDSRTDNDDKNLAGIKMIIRNAKYSIQNSDDLGRQAIIENVINPIRKKWCSIKNIQEIIYTDYGSYENPDYAKQYNQLSNIIFGTKEQQISGIRSLGGYGRLLDKTETSFISDEIIISDVEMQDGELHITGGLEVNDSDLNKMFQKINTDLFVNLEYDEESGILKENKNTKLIDALYNAAASDKSGGKVIEILINNGMIPNNWKNNGDVKEKAKELADTLNQQINAVNSYTIENIKEKEAKEKLELEMKSDKTELELQRLQALNYLEHHPEEARVLHEQVLQKTKDEIKYGGINNIVRKALAPIFVEEGKGAKGKNADIYNDIVGYGFWNLSDDNAKLMGEILVEIAITVVIAVVTGGAGAAAMAAILRGCALAARGARWVNLATKIVKVVEIGQKGYKGLSAGAKVVKLGYRSTSLLLEGTMFNAASTAVHSAMNGTSLDALNLNPIARENIQTAAFLGALSVGNQLAGAIMKVGGRTKVGIDIVKGLEKAHLKNPTVRTTSVVTELSTMLASEQVINITFGHDVIDPETGEVHTEHTLVAPTQEELCQTIGMILAFKAVKPQIWAKYEKKLNNGTLEICRSINKNEVLLREVSTGKIEKLQDLIDGRYNNYKPTPEQHRLHNQNEWLERQSEYEAEYNQVKDIISQLPENLRSESMKRLLEATDMVEISPNDIKRIQREIGLTGEDVNGVIGPKTLTRMVEYSNTTTHGPREVLNEENNILRITEILNKGNVITIDGVKYFFNGIKNGKAEFIVDKAAKKAAEQSGKNLPEQIEVTSLEELLDTRFNLEPGVHENNSSRYKKLQELINHEPIIVVNESELGNREAPDVENRISEEFDAQILNEGITIDGDLYKLEYRENMTQNHNRKGEFVWMKNGRVLKIAKAETKVLPENADGNRIRSEYNRLRELYVSRVYGNVLENYSRFLKTNTEISSKIESGKLGFLGRGVNELYQRGLHETLKGKPISEHESLILDFNTRFKNSLEFVSDKPESVQFLKGKELVKGTITDYGKSLLGENFESSPTKKAFFDKLKASMFYQHLDNPLKYCSHGADHSILVDRYVQNIIDSYPDVVNSVKERYGVNDEGAMQLLRLTAVFHDFGYPDIGGLAKSMHGPFGGVHFIDRFASAENSTFIDFIKNDLGITNQTKIDEIVTDMRDAIFFHSADKVEKGYLNRITYKKGSFLLGDNLISEGTSDFIEILTRESDGVMTITYRRGSEAGRINAENFKKEILKKYPNLDGNKIKIEEDVNSYDYDIEFKSTTEYQGRKGKVGDTGIEFQPIDLLTDPLAGIVRLADNMDMSMDRLTKIQSHPIFMNLFYNIGYEYRLENGSINTKTASYIYQKMEKLNKLDKKLKDGEISQEKHDSEYNELSIEILNLIDQANQNGGIEITIFDEKTGRPKVSVNNPFKVKFEGNILKGGKVDLYTYKKFIIDEMAKHEGILNDSDIQTIQNIAIDNDIGSYSFRHFIGLTPIKDVTIESTETSKRLVVKVDKDIYLNPDLRSQKLTEGSFVDRPVVEYHIRRLFDASGRVTVDKKANYHGLLQLTIIDSQTGELIGQGSRSRPDEKFNIKYEDNIHIPDQIIEGGEID